MSNIKSDKKKKRTKRATGKEEKNVTKRATGKNFWAGRALRHAEDNAPPHSEEEVS